MDSSPFNTWVIENTVEILRFLDFLLRPIFTEKVGKNFSKHNTCYEVVKRYGFSIVLVLWKSFI